MHSRLKQTFEVGTSVSLVVCRCLISQKEVQSFIERCMTAVGTKQHHARSLAEVLVEGDHRGHYSHGLNRMGQFSLAQPLYTFDIGTVMPSDVGKESTALSSIYSMEQIQNETTCSELS